MRAPSVYALKVGTLIDGTGQPPRKDVTVVVDGRSIVQVGPQADVIVPGDVPVYDLRDKTLMPGLIDGHVHLRAFAGEGEQDIHLWNVLTFTEEQGIHAAGNAAKALEAGVTTVRDTAGARIEIGVKLAMDQFVLPGARVVTAGFVGMTAGHGDMFCPAAIPNRFWRPVDGVDECRKLVREYARDGADLIKICTSGGVLSRGDKAEWRNFTMEETLAIVDEAHALGMKVAAHAHSRNGIKQALKAGVDTLEHGSQLDEELVEVMLRQGTWLCPTLALSEYMNSGVIAHRLPKEQQEKSAALQNDRLAAVRLAYKAGVKIFMGTDTCNTMPFGPYHAWELELMQTRMGMSATEAIVASTSLAAEAVGLGRETGTIAPGKWADLLIVDGDPLADVRILQDHSRLLGVFRDGRLMVNRGLPAAVPAN